MWTDLDGGGGSDLLRSERWALGVLSASLNPAHLSPCHAFCGLCTGLRGVLRSSPPTVRVYKVWGRCSALRQAGLTLFPTCYRPTWWALVGFCRASCLKDALCTRATLCASSERVRRASRVGERHSSKDVFLGLEGWCELAIYTSPLSFHRAHRWLVLCSLRSQTAEVCVPLTPSRTSIVFGNVASPSSPSPLKYSPLQSPLFLSPSFFRSCAREAAPRTLPFHRFKALRVVEDVSFR